MILNLESFKQMVRYGVVGVIGASIHFGTVILLVEVFKQNPVYSSAFGFSIVVAISYLLNKHWTFKVKEKGKSNRFFKYIVVSCLGFGINVSIMYYSVNIAHWSYILGQSIVTVVIPVSNFTLNKFWTFSDSGSPG